MSFFKHSRLQSPKYLQKKRKKLIGAMVLAFIFLFLLITIFVLLMRSSFLNIQNIEIAGAVVLAPEIIKEKAQSGLQGQYWSIIPKSNIFFYPSHALEQSLTDNFKEIDKVSIKRQGLSKIAITIKERIAAAIVCSGFHEEDVENDDCYYSDDSGYVFGKAKKPYPESFNKYYVSTAKGDIVSGTSFMDSGRFRDLQNFLGGALQGGLAPLGVLIGESGEYEMYIRPDTTVYFNDRSPFSGTLSNLLAFWRNATSTQSFDYINLRFGNTIYYSHKNATK